MECPICKNKETKVIFENYPGYIEGTNFSIYQCTKCDTQFISTKKINNNIYDKIYSNKNTPGYDRYLNYAENIKKHISPLKYLSDAEETYFPCYQFLKNKHKLEILEVGCGYGYLTYALNKAGHNTTGIDISKNAINYAKLNFKKNYILTDLKNYNSKKKFDLIIATELIEHLKDPCEFISTCLKKLKPKGQILLTTPNKDYYGKHIVWKTDLPPIHITWLSKNSFRYISKKYNLNHKFIKNIKYINTNHNKLADLLYSKLNILPSPILNKVGKPYTINKNIQNGRYKSIRHNIITFAPIRYTSNFIYNIIKNNETAVLGIILIKK